jgi:hypothetical protein
MAERTFDQVFNSITWWAGEANANWVHPADPDINWADPTSQAFKTWVYQSLKVVYENSPTARAMINGWLDNNLPLRMVEAFPSAGPGKVSLPRACGLRASIWFRSPSTKLSVPMAAFHPKQPSEVEAFGCPPACDSQQLWF